MPFANRMSLVSGLVMVAAISMLLPLRRKYMAPCWLSCSLITDVNWSQTKSVWTVFVPAAARSIEVRTSSMGDFAGAGGFCGSGDFVCARVFAGAGDFAGAGELAWAKDSVERRAGKSTETILLFILGLKLPSVLALNPDAVSDGAAAEILDGFIAGDPGFAGDGFDDVHQVLTDLILTGAVHGGGLHLENKPITSVRDDFYLSWMR